MKGRLLTLAACLLLATVTIAHAAPAYPTRPVRIITQAAPGAVIDIISRQLATMLSAELGQPVLVSNHPGAGGNVAVNTLLAAKADGYTIGVTGAAPFNENFFLLDVRYKFDDLTPISLVSLSRMGVITQPDRSWNTLRDAFEQAKAEDLTLKVAIMDARSRESMERLAEQEGVKLALIPQQGGTPILTAVMGGHADLGVLGSILVDNTKGGTIKTLGILGEQRMLQLPEVSTLLEQGYDVVYDSPIVLFAKTGVPDEIITMLSDLMGKLMEDPEYQRVIVEAVNAEPMPAGREHATRVLREGYNRMAAERGQPLLPE